MSINLKIKKWSAWLDLSQSLSGVILAVFLWTHLVLVSSILFGADAMSWVARMMELSFLSSDGHGYPWVVTCIAIGIAVLAFIHVLVALQKLPMSLQQQSATPTNAGDQAQRYSLVALAGDYRCGDFIAASCTSVADWICPRNYWPPRQC